MTQCPSRCKDTCDSSCPSHCCTPQYVPAVPPTQPKCNPICQTNCLPSCSKGCCKIKIVPLPTCPGHCIEICESFCPTHCCFSEKPSQQSISTQQRFCPLNCSSNCIQSCPKFCCKLSLPPPSSCPKICLSNCLAACPQHCCRRPYFPNFLESPSTVCPLECAIRCDTSCPSQCCANNLEQPPLLNQSSENMSITNGTIPLTGYLITSPSMVSPCPSYCLSYCTPNCHRYCCNREQSPYLVKTADKTMSPIVRTLTGQDADYKSKVVHRLSELLSSPLKLCQPSCFANCSAECPRICCDVRRKRKMYVFKRKKKTQIDRAKSQQKRKTHKKIKGNRRIM